MKIVDMLKPPPNQGQQAMNNPLGSYERGVHVHVHLRAVPAPRAKKFPLKAASTADTLSTEHKKRLARLVGVSRKTV